MKNFKSLQSLINIKQNKSIIKSVIKTTDFKKNIQDFFQSNNLNVIIINIDLKKELITLKCKNSIQANHIKLLQNNLISVIKKNFKIITKISS
ncbi:MAG: hypothetical protein AAB593_02090 [Patescibacteria group bacterium]|mgnify:CR=1 FL=1